MDDPVTVQTIADDGVAVLAARHRLRRRRDFTAVVRAGRRSARGALVVHLVSGPAVSGPAGGSGPARGGGPGSGDSRVGLVIPRAVGGAVVRNRVRRRLRHLVHERLGTLAPGSDLVIRAREGAAARSYQDLGCDLDATLVAVGAQRMVRR